MRCEIHFSSTKDSHARFPQTFKRETTSPSFTPRRAKFYSTYNSCYTFINKFILKKKNGLSYLRQNLYFYFRLFELVLQSCGKLLSFFFSRPDPICKTRLSFSLQSKLSTFTPFAAFSSHWSI